MVFLWFFLCSSHHQPPARKAHRGPGIGYRLLPRRGCHPDRDLHHAPWGHRFDLSALRPKTEAYAGNEWNSAICVYLCTICKPPRLNCLSTIFGKRSKIYVYIYIHNYPCLRKSLSHFNSGIAIEFPASWIRSFTT